MKLDTMIDIYEDFVIKKQRQHMDMATLLETQDVYDKSLPEALVAFRKHLRTQEPWFMNVASKYRDRS